MSNSSTVVADRDLSAEIEIGPEHVEHAWILNHIEEINGSLVYSVPQVLTDLVIWPDPQKFSRPLNLGLITKVSIRSLNHFNVETRRTGKFERLASGAFPRLTVRLAPGIRIPDRDRIDLR